MKIIKEQKQKQVLIVAYAFPPVGGAGVQRPAKFVKYLREFGWEPAVLTCANPSVPVIDEELSKDLPEGVDIYKARTLEPSYKKKAALLNSNIDSEKNRTVPKIKVAIKTMVGYLLLPDIQVLWWPALILRLVSVLRKRHFDCVFVTAPPFSSLVPVVILCRLFNIPVIADFRDEWTFNRRNIENASRNRFVDWIDEVLERTVIRFATSVTVASGKYLVGMDTRHPGRQLMQKGIVITNGYDCDDFRKSRRDISQKKKQKLRLVYSGTVWAATSLRVFMASVEELLLEDPVLKKYLSIDIIGRVVSDEDEYLQKEIFTGVVHLSGYCSHEAVLAEIMNADILLLTLTDSPQADRIIPAKTFEYMATGTAILALVPDGEVKSILQDNYPNTWFSNPDDKQHIKTLIQSFVSDFKGGKDNFQLHDSDSNVCKFSRLNLTKRLARLLDELRER